MKMAVPNIYGDDEMGRLGCGVEMVVPVNMEVERGGVRMAPPTCDERWWRERIEKAWRRSAERRGHFVLLCASTCAKSSETELTLRGSTWQPQLVAAQDERRERQGKESLRRALHLARVS